MEQTEVKELWDEYRVAKCFPNLTELLMRKEGKEFLPEFNQETGYEAPPPGSMYYVNQIDPPLWFVADLQSDNIVTVLSAIKEESKIVTFKGKHKRKKRKH